MKRSSLRQHWREILQLHADSDLNVAEFCRQRQLSANSFYRWRKRLGGEDRVEETFVPLTVAEQPLVPPQVEVRFPNGAVMRLPHCPGRHAWSDPCGTCSAPDRWLSGHRTGGRRTASGMAD